MFAYLTKASRFTNDAAGVEKSLRLLQNIFQVVAAYSLTASDAAPWLHARKQFALGRRYLRFFKFYDAFTQAYTSFNRSTGLMAALEVGKWSCLGMYLVLESSTIMDAMEIRKTTWAPVVFGEAMRFWFFSLCFSLAISSLQLFDLYSALPTPILAGRAKAEGKSKGKADDTNVAEKSDDTAVRAQAHEFAVQRRNIMRRLVTDACDLLIPGATTGWIVSSSATVGMASVVSTVLPSMDIWARVQKND